MDFSNELLFFFSALGAFNGVLLSLYFFFIAKPKNISSYLLGGLLAVISIRIGKSVFYYFNPQLSKFYLQIGLSACFLIGPFLYFYIRSKTATTQTPKSWLLQLGLLALLVIVFGIVYPYETHPDIWGTYFFKTLYYQWLLFIIVSAFLLKDHFKKLFSSSSKLNYNDSWMLSVFFGTTLIWAAYYTSSYTSYIVGALSFSFVLYLSVLLLFHKKRQSNKAAPQEKYANQKISTEEATALFNKVDSYINTQQAYKNPNLTLPELAKQLHIRTHLLSQFINDNLNKNFSQFINEYRIEEAKRLLTSNSNLKIEVIAEQCGFNSNSTFYTAFKKVTNTTPSKFIKQ